MHYALLNRLMEKLIVQDDTAFMSVVFIFSIIKSFLIKLPIKKSAYLFLGLVLHHLGFPLYLFLIFSVK